ncbi:MAG: hypothetical protein PHX61_14220 [Alphaproteobacteria bacterium]|nr:hypothetical protein [Alphaproteobacteria bacterium]
MSERKESQNEYWRDLMTSAALPGLFSAAVGIILFVASSLQKKEDE